MRWRDADNIPPATQVLSAPYDLDAQYARQHTTPWVGSTVHRTATWAEDLPQLLPHGDTASGPVADGAATPTIPAALQQRG